MGAVCTNTVPAGKVFRRRTILLVRRNEAQCQTWPTLKMTSLPQFARTMLQATPLMAKKILSGLALLLVCLGLFAVWGWVTVQHRILANAKAPNLVSSPEPQIDFRFRKLDGTPRHLAQTKGKVVFVDLWGTWCIQCVAEMPTVQALYNRFRNDPDVTFLIISRLDTPEAVRRYARRHHYDLPFYITNDADIPASMQLHQFPATFLYSRNGTMMVKHTGAADWSTPAVVSYINDLKTR